MLDESQLAQKLHEALAQKTDGHRQPTPISDQTKNYAAGIVAALKTAIVNNLPGTITGVTAPGAPLSAGAGTGGIITITPAAMIARANVGIPSQATPMLTREDTAIIAYIGTGLVTFVPGKITGNCTNTPIAPGPLAAGAGMDGMITALTGAGATAAVSAVIGAIGPDMIRHYTALIDYILANAVVTYATGTVVGVCPPGGGPLTAGAGIGGTIS